MAAKKNETDTPSLESTDPDMPKFYVRTLITSRLNFHCLPENPAQPPVVGEVETDQGGGLADVYNNVDRVVLARYAPSGVVVDENLCIIQYRGDTGPYIKPAPGPPTTELLLMAREGLLDALRETLDSARRDNAPARMEDLRVKTNNHFEDIDLVVIPVTDSASAARYFVILFERRAAGTEAAEAQSPVPAADADTADGQEIGRLNHDLTATKAYLQSVIDQKEAANEELRAANEELRTLNEELQNRIRIADELGDDVANLIDAAEIPFIILGPDLCIRRFTHSAQEVMDLHPGDVGRPLGELKSIIHIPDLDLLVREVIDTLEIKQREVADEAGAWYKVSLRPYKTLDQKIGGVVLTFIDIDMLKRREQEIKESRDYAVSIVETVREPLLVLDGHLRVRTANRSFYESFQVSAAETEGRLIY